MPPDAFSISETRCAKLAKVPEAVRASILDAPRSEASRDDAWSRVKALGQIECRNPPALSETPAEVRVAAWNLQQAYFPEASADILAANRIDLALLTEIDIGMRRTGQRHTVADMAERMGSRFGYAAGVEFFELLSPDSAIAPSGRYEPNRIGFHGNGWITRLPARRPAVIRLGSEADWFINPRRNQRRVGGRMAAAGVFPLGSGEFVAASAHLESDTDAAGRGRQMEALLDALDLYAAGLPVLVGGDFNAGARHPEFDAASEDLFAIAAAHGYDWLTCNTSQPTSRRSLVQNAVQQDKARYDWFFARGLSASEPGVLPALDERDTPLSDHDAIVVTISRKPT